MTHQSNPELLNTVLQLLNEEGTGGLAEGIRLLVDEAMRQERSHALKHFTEKKLRRRRWTSCCGACLLDSSDPTSPES